MDAEWARARLERYLAVCEEIRAHQRGNGWEWDRVCEELNQKAQLQISTVSGIVKYVDPTWSGPVLMPPSHVGEDGEGIVRRALGAVMDRVEWETHMAPESPSLQADQMHSTVWDAASPVWETGEYKVAVQQAAVSLSAHVKAKAQSALSDRELMEQVFSPDLPKGGQTRLHFPGDSSDKTWRSRQHGLHLIAQGAFAGIRNVAAHDDVKWGEHEALEHLAILSVVARWAEETTVVTTG